ncbi:sugar transferase [Primorskyibacter sp. 2E107]|uniref:sugar transferase n=1 Tax=Primorskyibacter sp. 2E107 TaxID=3403458 RepID=UPI003AF781AB
MSLYAYNDPESLAAGKPGLVSGYEATAGKPSGFYRAIGKRLFDIAAVLIAAPVVLLILLPMLLLVACDGSNPLYTQMRVGRNGRSYRMWKLRSMVPQADQKLQAHLDSDSRARAEWDHHQKLKNDPRITRVGRILRKSSLDELPQLWNVLRGDMSLVGPRPMLEDQRAFYPARDYYDLRPGITGLWQVSARNESGFADRARFDTEYNRRFSLKQDLKILVATVGVVVKATGH